MESTPKNYSNLFFLISFVINIITCFIVWHYVSITGPVAPLHYNVVSGFDEIGKTTVVYELPAFGFIILFLNLFISKYFTRLGSYIGVTTSATSAFVSLLLLFNALFLWQVAG